MKKTINIEIDAATTPEEVQAARQEVGREIGVRKSAYRHWVAGGSLRQADADAQMGRMYKAYELLKAIEKAFPCAGQMSFNLGEEDTI